MTAKTASPPSSHPGPRSIVCSSSISSKASTYWLSSIGGTSGISRLMITVTVAPRSIIAAMTQGTIPFHVCGNVNWKNPCCREVWSMDCLPSVMTIPNLPALRLNRLPTVEFTPFQDNVEYTSLLALKHGRLDCDSRANARIQW